MTPLTESQFQKRVIQACLREENCHVVRIARMWAVMGGVPDLYIKHPSYPPIWLELKVNHRQGSNLTVNLSPLQRHFMRREQASGGHTGWVVLNQSKGMWIIYAGNSPEIIGISTSFGRHADSDMGNSPRINIIRILEAVIHGRTKLGA